MATLRRAVSRKVRILGPVPPPHGGVSVYVNALRELLKADGVRTWSYPYRNAGALDVSFFRHRRLGIVPLALNDGYGATVLDASHFHLEYPNALLISAWLVLKTLGRFEWIKTIHDGSLPGRFSRFSSVDKRLFRLACSGVSEFIVVNEHLRQWLQCEIKVRQRVTTIPPLLPLPAARGEPHLSPSLMKEMEKYLASPKRVCSIGVFARDYGFADIAAAVESLRQETGSDIGLLLLDGVFDRDEEYRKDVLQAREWITVIENAPHHQVFPILRSSNAFARGFRAESFGLSRVEAVWCGVPVVATEAGETRGMLTYDFGDRVALRDQLRRALYDPPADLAAHAAVFRAEAERNLQAIRNILRLESAPQQP